MPQMAPLMWTSLFMFFTSLLLLVMIKISFFSKINKNNNFSPTEINKNNLNWKW